MPKRSELALEMFEPEVSCTVGERVKRRAKAKPVILSYSNSLHTIQVIWDCNYTIS